MGNLNQDGTDKALPGIRLRKNGTAVDAVSDHGFQSGHRSQVNFEEGSGITLAVTDEHISGPEREWKVSVAATGVPAPHTHPQSDVTDLVSDLAAKEATANKNAASGYPGLDGSSKLTGSQQVYGTGVNTACQGNDSRLSDARTPASHVLATNTGLGAEHTISGAADKQALFASSATAANFRAIALGDLPATIDSNARINVLADDTQVGLRRGIDFTTHALDTTKARMTITDNSFQNQVLIEIEAQWEYLGGKQLGAAAVTTGVLTIPARDLILIQFFVAGYSAADIAALRFNADSGNNYWSRYLSAAAGVATLTNNVNTSVPLARLHAIAGTGRVSGYVAIGNHASHPKGGCVSVQLLTAAAGTSGTLQFGGFEWVNTAAQITSVEMRTAGGVNTLTAGSGFAVYGKDIP